METMQSNPKFKNTKIFFLFVYCLRKPKMIQIEIKLPPDVLHYFIFHLSPRKQNGGEKLCFFFAE